MESFVATEVEGKGLDTLVDVGAGECPYREMLEPHVRKYITVDLPGCGADVDVGPDGRVPLPDGVAQVLVSNQVLEHVADPTTHVAELARLLAPDGVLVLSTHGHWMYHPTPTDYWRWTGPGLRKLLSDAGLHVVLTTGILGRGAAGLQLFHDGIVHRVHHRLRPLLGLLLNCIIPLVERWDTSDRHDDACVFVVTVRR